jgi:hypothetical protein
VLELRCWLRARSLMNEQPQYSHLTTVLRPDLLNLTIINRVCAETGGQLSISWTEGRDCNYTQRTNEEVIVRLQLCNRQSCIETWLPSMLFGN